MNASRNYLYIAIPGSGVIPMKYIYLIVGRSGSGKSTITDYIVNSSDLTQVDSYTTRPKRGPDDKNHTFITEEEFDKLENLCAYTEINGYRYGVTSDMIDNNDLYIIDPSGVEYFKKNYNGSKKPFVIKIDVPEKICKERMLSRGDSKENVRKRLEEFDTVFDTFRDYDLLVENTGSIEDSATKIIKAIELNEIGNYYIDQNTTHNDSK